MDAANDGDVIKVAVGTYTDVNNYDGLAQVVYISKTITLRGGYTTAFTDPPDPEANPTTLDAQRQGRVLYITGDISPTVEGLRITGGDAGWGAGGGVYVTNATVTIRDNWVFNKTAYNSGRLELRDSDATLSGNTISSNSANGRSGGGLCLSGRAATLSGNTMSDNTAAQEGGGLALGGSGATLRGNIVFSNTANINGGGLYLYDSAATFTNTVIAANWANDTGSGVFVEGSSARLLHSTITRNSGGDGSGVHLTNIGGIRYSTVALTNTILVSRTVGVTVTSGNAARLEGTLWGNGAWANGSDWGGDGIIITGTVNVWGDPAFTCAGTLCVAPYRIGPGSAALDKGVDAGVRTGIDHEPRAYQTPDLGADEYWPPGALSYVYLPLVLRYY